MPTVAVSANDGDVWVTWGQALTDSTSDVWVTRIRDGRVEPAQRLDTVPGRASISKECPPQVVTTPNGDVLVAWSSNRATRPTQTDAALVVARRAAGDSKFGAPIEVGPGLPGRPRVQLYSDLAVDQRGEVHLCWLDLGRYVASTDASAGDEHHGMDAMVDDADYCTTSSRDGGRQFEPPQVIDTVACICCRTSIAASGNGTVQLLWRHVFPGLIRDPVMARSTDGGRTFAQPVRVHEDGWRLAGCPDIGPSVVVSTAGIDVAWYTGAAGRVGACVAHSTDGTSLSVPRALVAGDRVPPTEVKLARWSGQTWAVYEDSRRDPAILRVVDLHSGVPGSKPLEVGTGRNPGVGAGGERMAIVWEERGEIWLRLCTMD